MKRAGAIAPALPMFLFVLSLGSQTASDMPLSLVGFQNHSYFLIKDPVVLGKAKRKVFMHRGFGYAEMLCYTPNGFPVFDHVHSQPAGSLPDVIVHARPSLLPTLCRYTLCS
jgi:hypothetical protein